jgi:hypothetical protein
MSTTAYFIADVLLDLFLLQRYRPGRVRPFSEIVRPRDDWVAD